MAITKNTDQKPAQVPVQEVTGAGAVERLARQNDERNREIAEKATQTAQEQGRLPTNSAVTNPAPARGISSPSGAIMEDEVARGLDVEHPAVDNNPRRNTSAVMNGVDWNDPTRRPPTEREFVGQGLDLSVYGAAAPPDAGSTTAPTSPIPTEQQQK